MSLKAFYHLFLFVYSKATSIEIEQLNARVVEAETRLKTEVVRIKKKLQIQITELEMSLDSANKMNIDLQKTIKKQSLQLTEISAHYDELQRQLQVTLDQLSVSQRKVQALTAEVEEIRGNYESVSVFFTCLSKFLLLIFRLFVVRGLLNKQLKKLVCVLTN